MMRSTEPSSKGRRRGSKPRTEIRQISPTDCLPVRGMSSTHGRLIINPVRVRPHPAPGVFLNAPAIALSSRECPRSSLISNSISPPPLLSPPSRFPPDAPASNFAAPRLFQRRRPPGPRQICTRREISHLFSQTRHLHLRLFTPSPPPLGTMQLRVGTDSDIFSKYGSPSRPISPTALAVSTDAKKITTSGNEQREINNRTTTVGSQSDLEIHPRQQNHQQQSTSSPSAIPPELIDHIVDHLHDDKQSLIQCSRTSRVFSHATSYHLFGTVRIPSVRRCIQFQELVRSSLFPLPSTSATLHSCSSPSPSSLPYSSSSTSLPASRTSHQQLGQVHPHHGPTNTNAHGYHVHPSACSVPAAGWDVSRFVRKIEFYKLDPQSPIEEYVAEVVKLVRMLPRIREVFFGWMQAKGLERIGQAFAAASATAGHHSLLVNPQSSVNSETRPGQTVAGGPLKLHLDLVDFDSVPGFLDFLGSFGGRLRELSLTNVSLGRWDGNNGKGDIEGRCLPGLESVCLGFDGG
jgi:hypothetical protein